VFALLMKLMYWRPRHFYVEHLLLLVHNHSATFLLFGLALAIGAIPGLAGVGGVLKAATFAYLVWYLYQSLRRVYGQGGGWTFSKFMVLGLAYVVAAIVVVGTTALFSVATT
jgi:hypothetical protein